MLGAIGTLLGALDGHEVGSSLDRADQEAALHVEKQAYTAPIGQAITWNNPDSGHSGKITPTREGTDEGGRYCRESEQGITVGEQPEKAYGTACRQADGTFQVVQK